MKHVATLSGWGQPHDALDSIAPNAQHIHYEPLTDLAAALQHIAERAAHATTIIGWSLGGMLALQATAQRLISPQHLILLAAPYQFAQHPLRTIGMDPLSYQYFCDNYHRAPQRTLAKSYKLISHGDKHENHVSRQLANPAQQPTHHWGYWLEQLGQLSCASLPLGHLPKTTIIHGKRDAVIPFEQAQLLHAALPESQLLLWEDCGHAPHLHHPQAITPLLAG